MVASIPKTTFVVVSTDKPILLKLGSEHEDDVRRCSFDKQWNQCWVGLSADSLVFDSSPLFMKG